jgi:hypothetical protein
LEKIREGNEESSRKNMVAKIRKLEEQIANARGGGAGQAGGSEEPAAKRVKVETEVALPEGADEEREEGEEPEDSEWQATGSDDDDQGLREGNATADTSISRAKVWFPAASDLRQQIEASKTVSSRFFISSLHSVRADHDSIEFLHLRLALYHSPLAINPSPRLASFSSFFTLTRNNVASRSIASPHPTTHLGSL